MSKPKVVGLDPKDPMSFENVAINNARVRSQANPLMRQMMDEVQNAIDHENSKLDAQSEGDAKLRAWAKQLLGFQISMTQIEKLRDVISTAKSGIPFTYEGQLLIKTPFDTVDRVERYLFVLEAAIIDMHKTKQELKQFTSAGFFGLIKLAFNRLIKGAKNG